MLANLKQINIVSHIFMCHILVTMLKTWSELSRVKLYRNYLKGNKDYFELAEGLSYLGFDLTKGKIIVSV